MYAVVAAPDKKELIMNSIGDVVIFGGFGGFDQAGLKGVFEKVLRIPLDALIVDADAGPGEVLLNAVKTYRLHRPSTRIVLLAPGRTPGDRLVASLVHRGVFDIIASEDWAERLKNVLERAPADYSAAARWDAQSSDEEENAGKKGLFNLLAAGKAKRHNGDTSDNKVGKPEGPAVANQAGEENSESAVTIAERLTSLTLQNEKSVAEGTKNIATEKAPRKKKISGPRLPAGRKPTVILGLGNPELDNWFANTFRNDFGAIYISSGAEDFKTKIDELRPDVAVLMRLSSKGGMPEAPELAVTAAGSAQAVLFIAGDLDEEGVEIVDYLKNNGIEDVLSCQKGEFISGEELVYKIFNILQNVENAAEDKTEEKKDRLKILKSRSEVFSQLFNKTPGPACQKKKIKISPFDEGVELEEKPVNEVYNENVKNPTAIVRGGVFAVVTPWKPGLAGRIAAQAVKMFAEVEGSEVAYIGTSRHSTGALWLNIPEEELVLSDWRVPGSQCPIKKDNLVVYAVDPAKDLDLDDGGEVWAILKEVRKTATYTVMDLGGDMDMAQKAARQGRAVVLVVLPGADAVELKVSQLWLRNMMDGKKNVVLGIDLRGCPPAVPGGVKPKLIVRNNPADALCLAIRRSKNDEFLWN